MNGDGVKTAERPPLPLTGVLIRAGNLPEVLWLHPELKVTQHSSHKTPRLASLAGIFIWGTGGTIYVPAGVAVHDVLSIDLDCNVRGGGVSRNSGGGCALSL